MSLGEGRGLLGWGGDGVLWDGALNLGVLC